MLSSETATWLIVLWFAAIGGAVGSFLNVVVYRLPLGLSLSNPPSHCPNCKQRIRWFDNVPVFGWLKLRGRCRSCHNPISVRYPLIEAFTALMFGVLAAFEFLSAGANLPFRSLEAAGEAPLVALYLYHVTLLCTLLCAALIEIDGQRPPLRLFGFAAAVGVAMPLLWPALRPWGALWPWTEWPELPRWVAGALDGLAGVAAGFLLSGAARLCGRLTRCRDASATCHGSSARPTGSLSLVCVGAFLGWQAAIALGLATGVIKLTMLAPQRVWPKLRLPASVMLALFSLIWILLWVRLVSPWEP